MRLTLHGVDTILVEAEVVVEMARGVFLDAEGKGFLFLLRGV